ncbi:lysozyme inhibitor LprI family protein [Rugamonas apoptosis]|uniref:DUF1311 domain-containing protein n=2 Tax=Rugamonas apoptosis TaxID=2758570 RepID=A0A7W2FCT4_9BURK|nr:lysozyme inhibitor LprI family protein [Rugamonas apoptosis]MBA5689396.1 DUF1311 domain-containing protein [Rugamonas apoptosis]
MNKTGGVIGIIAGIFAVIAALVTLVFGGVASAFQAERASTVVGLGWGGVIFSFLVIVFAAISFSKAKPAGWGLIISAVLGAVLGGTFVAIFMALAFIGGILVLTSAKPNPSISATTDVSATLHKGGGKGWLIAIVAVLVVIGSGGVVSMLGTKDQASEPVVEAPVGVGAPQATVAAGASAEALAKLVQADVTGPEANKLTELGAAPPDNQMAAFMRLSGTEKVTEAPQAARSKAVLDAMTKAKGTVIIWDLVVDNIKPAGAGAFHISTKCDELANRVTPPAQVQMAQPDTNVLLSSRTPDESKVIESLPGCSVIKVKAVVAGFDANTKKVQLNPAIIVKAGGYDAHDVKIAGSSEVPAPISEIRPSVQETPHSEAEEKDAILSARNAQPMDDPAEPDHKRLYIVDAELNRVYAGLIKGLPAERRAELKQSEIAWIRKKEATCKQDLKCTIQFTEQRLVELNKF